MKKFLIVLLVIITVLLGSGCESYFTTVDTNINQDADSIITDYEELEKDLYGPYQVVRVVDGDTIIVNIYNTETRIRLIGVNTAESVHPDADKNTSEGMVASDYTKNLLTTKKVYLEYDKDIYDDYGRVLAYVYLDDKKTMVNELLLKNGYAETMTIAPNVKYAEKFEDILQKYENK